MNRLLPTPRTEFFELNFALNFFLVFARVIIAPFANGTAQRDKVIRVFDLCHIGYITTIHRKMQTGGRRMRYNKFSSKVGRFCKFSLIFF